MRRTVSPVKPLFSAFLLGAVTVGLLKLLARAPETGSSPQANPAGAGDRRSSLRSRPGGRGTPRGARAPYAQALSDTGNGPEERPAGIPAPPEEAKRTSALGDTFSSGTAGEVTPSADTKGGLGQGGR
ncbi:hypothetical protein [Pigmentiphaga litoralis]|uniref:hypothetical protein n=1 Tax=Pigmentiphaga litoralis TaxID=516702 RepID=UPI003B42B916